MDFFKLILISIFSEECYSLARSSHSDEGHKAFHKRLHAKTKMSTKSFAHRTWREREIQNSDGMRLVGLLSTTPYYKRNCLHICFFCSKGEPFLPVWRDSHYYAGAEAFIQFTTQHAEHAPGKSFNKLIINGRRLTVRWACTQEARGTCIKEEYMCLDCLKIPLRMGHILDRTKKGLHNNLLRKHYTIVGDLGLNATCLLG